MKKFLSMVLLIVILGISGYLIINISEKKSFVKSAGPKKEITETESERDTNTGNIGNTVDLIMKYHNEGKKEEVTNLAEKYLKTNSDDMDVWVVLIENYVSLNKLDKAEEVAKAALDVEESALVLRTLSLIYRFKADNEPGKEQEYLSEALSAIEKAMALDVTDPRIFSTAAIVYQAQGKRDKALEMVNKTLEIDPEDSIGLDMKKSILSEEK